MREWKATQGANGMLAPNDWWNLTLSCGESVISGPDVSAQVGKFTPTSSHLTMCSPLCLMPKFHVLIPHTLVLCINTSGLHHPVPFYTLTLHPTPLTPHSPHPHTSYQHPTPHTLTLRINTPPPYPTLRINSPTHPHPSIHHTLSLSHPHTFTQHLNLTYPPHVSHLLPPYGITPHTSPSHLNTSHHNTHLYITTSPSHLRTSLHAASQPQPHTLIC